MLLLFVDGMKEICIDNMPRDRLMGEFVSWQRRFSLEMLLLSNKKIGVGFEILIHLVLLLLLLQELLSLV